MIKKRYIHLTEEMLEEHPNIGAYMAPSLNIRQEIITAEVPKLGKEAALKALKEWGQPKSKITHLVFCTTSGVEMPGADYKLANLLGLEPSVRRVMLYHQGCYAGDQARKAFDGFLDAAYKASNAIDTQATSAQENLRAVAGAAVSFAEQNMAASFNYAQRLVRATSVEDVLKIQTEFAKAQIEALTKQVQEMSAVAGRKGGGKS